MRLYLLFFFWVTVLMAPNIAFASVTVFPSNVLPRKYNGPDSPSHSAEELFKSSVPSLINGNRTHIITSSHDSVEFSDGSGSGVSYVPSSDSFVRGAIEAWGQHMHLVVRPDEVWYAVLVQINYYMVSHAEEIRHLFVDHEGKEEIIVKGRTIDIIIAAFGAAIQARIKTDWLLDWIRPGFSTSTQQDDMMTSILMMGVMQHYFEYTGVIICGLPSVTLLGEKKDWEKLLAKLDKLAEFGSEPESFSRRLRPIFERFVLSFEKPESDEIHKFWNTIVHGYHPQLCGEPYKVTGWITAFFYWDTEGKPYGRDDNNTAGEGIEVYYPIIDNDSRVPVGWVEVPITLVNFAEEEYNATIVGGNIGKMIKRGAPKAYIEAMTEIIPEGEIIPYAEQAILKPGSGWALFGPSEVDEATFEEPLNWAWAVSSLMQCDADEPEHGRAAEQSIVFSR